MLFNSLNFLVFFLAFFPTYWLLSKNLKVRNTIILIGSYIFYGSWDWRFLSLIIISTLVDFYCGRKIYVSEERKIKKFYLFLSVGTNIGILGIFKYFGFFVNSFVDLLSAIGIHTNHYSLYIILPVGISFYTFQTMTYSLDIYNGKIKPTKSLLNFAAFVSFFPQLVAGPIERAKSLLPQLERINYFSIEQFKDGLFLVLWGLIKKILIADRLAVYVDTVFATPDQYMPTQIAVAVLFFSIQIYCDFSGYSDIARGLAKLLGIDLMVNFNTPYFAYSLRDFWQRWHISLSTWFRDYLYIPLGGSNTTRWRFRRNILITFIVSGLWHGANYTFLIWGGLHAIGYMLDPFSKTQKNNGGIKELVIKATGILSTYMFVNITWIFFRANNIEDAYIIIQKLVSPLIGYDTVPEMGSIIVAMSGMEFGLSVYFIVLLLVIDYFIKNKGIDIYAKSLNYPVRWVMSWIFLVNILVFSPSDTGSFIYFQF